MGITKKDKFDSKTIALADIAKALEHPARIAILQYLLKTNNSCVCGDIVEALPLAQSTVSQHLKELKKVGILHGDVDGTSVCYCINPIVWKEIQNSFDLFFNLLKDSSCNTNCC